MRKKPEGLFASIGEFFGSAWKDLSDNVFSPIAEGFSLGAGYGDQNTSISDKPAYELTDDERSRETEREESWMNHHSYSQRRIPYSMLLTGAYR